MSVRVEQIDRGQAMQPGDIFVVSCFRWSRPQPGMRNRPSVDPRRGGPHSAVRLACGGSENEGNYPDWYEVIEPSPRWWIVRLFDSRKFRVFLAFVGIIGVGMLACDIRKRLRREPSAKKQ